MIAVKSTDNNWTDDQALDNEIAVQEIIKEVEKNHKDIDFRIMGNQLINHEINKASGDSMITLMIIAFVLVIVVLTFIYRSVSVTLIGRVPS